MAVNLATAAGLAAANDRLDLLPDVPPTGLLSAPSNETGVITAINAGFTWVGGSHAVVPPTRRPVRLEWGGMAVLTTAQTGNDGYLLLCLFETTGAGTVLLEVAIARVRNGDTAGDNPYSLRGSHRIRAASTVRTFDLYTIAGKDTGSVTPAGQMKNSIGAQKTWLTAEVY